MDEKCRVLDGDIMKKSTGGFSKEKFFVKGRELASGELVNKSES